MGSGVFSMHVLAIFPINLKHEAGFCTFFDYGTETCAFSCNTEASFALFGDATGFDARFDFPRKHVDAFSVNLRRESPSNTTKIRTNNAYEQCDAAFLGSSAAFRPD